MQLAVVPMRCVDSGGSDSGLPTCRIYDTPIRHHIGCRLTTNAVSGDVLPFVAGSSRSAIVIVAVCEDGHLIPVPTTVYTVQYPLLLRQFPPLLICPIVRTSTSKAQRRQLHRLLSPTMEKPAAVWDTETQEVHGGQTWRSLGDSLVSDFSVTTNAFGAPASALVASGDALAHIHHYPAADCGEATDAVAKLTSWPASQLLLGNGASEFIDLVMRAGPPGAFRPGPYPAAYMEYNRAAKASGRTVISADAPGSDAAVTVVIHPNSPTGHSMSLAGIEDIVNGTDGVVVVDESFILFKGEDWREHSALNLVEKYPEKLVVLASWTKLWACPGLRLGSISASPAWTKKLKILQTPWSCSTPAQAFFVAACADREYLSRTWTTLPGWKDAMHKSVRALGWEVNEKSPLWVPWVYLDCGSAEVAAKAADVAHVAGCPVRLCASFGTPSCIRLGVRDMDAQKALFAAWTAAFVDVDRKIASEVVTAAAAEPVAIS